MQLINKFSNLSQTKQLFIARAIYDIGLFIFDIYYMATIFKLSNNIEGVVINILLTFITIFIGFGIGTYQINIIGLSRNLKLSFVLYLLIGLYGILFAENSGNFFYIISTIRGLAEGIYWSSINTIELVGIHADSRSKFFNASIALFKAISIILPGPLGYILFVTNDYRIVFILFMSIILIGAILPFKFSDELAAFEWKKAKKILKKKNIFKLLMYKSILAAQWMMEWVVFSLIPFVILGTEFSMGIYLSISAFIGTIITILSIKSHLKKKINRAYYALYINLFSETFLAIDFSYISLYTNEGISNITSAFSHPVMADVNARSTNAVIETNESGLEYNLIQECAFTFSRLILGIILIIIARLNIDTTLILQLLIIIMSILRLTTFHLFHKLNNKYVTN